MNKLDVHQVRAAATCFALKLKDKLQEIDPHHKYFESTSDTRNIAGISIQVAELQSGQALFADFYFRWDKGGITNKYSAACVSFKLYNGTEIEYRDSSSHFLFRSRYLNPKLLAKEIWKVLEPALFEQRLERLTLATE